MLWIVEKMVSESCAVKWHGGSTYWNSSTNLKCLSLVIFDYQFLHSLSAAIFSQVSDFTCTIRGICLYWVLGMRLQGFDRHNFSLYTAQYGWNWFGMVGKGIFYFLCMNSVNIYHNSVETKGVKVKADRKWLMKCEIFIKCYISI